MVRRRCFVQFPHPGEEHKPDRSGNIGWNNKSNGHKRKFMQIRGKWIEPDGTQQPDVLWAWGEWEPESDCIREFDAKHDRPYHPRYLWEPYWIPMDRYEGLHNTDPFVFGDCFLYSNCGQVGSSRRGLKHLDRGSVIAFGSGKIAEGQRKWMLDTVLVVRDSCAYDPRRPYEELGFKVPDAFLKVTGKPLAADLAGNPEKSGFRLYSGATPDDPVNGMFSFFPAMRKGACDAGFRRPFICLQDKSFNRRSFEAPKGQGQDRTRDELLCLWKSLVTQVRAAGLVLGTWAAVPEQRAHEGASDDSNTDGNRSSGHPTHSGCRSRC